MPIKMVSTRRHFLKSENKEYNKDDPFTVADNREADRLVRLGRARRAPTDKSAGPAAAAVVAPAGPAAPVYAPPPDPAPTAVDPMTTENSPLFDTDSRPARRTVYKRRDLRSED